jgi:hypothetical protein
MRRSLLWMELRIETQQRPSADEVSALVAVVRPTLTGTLYALKRDVVAGRTRMSSSRCFRVSTRRPLLQLQPHRTNGSSREMRPPEPI